jgi:serine/threonine protein kinase
MSEELLGQQLSNYTLTQVLYRGTFADTYLGEHVRMRATAMIIVLHASLTKNQQDAFQEMARRIAGLTHPHIARTIDSDLYHGTPFLVQEYFPLTLRQLYSEESQLPLRVVVTYVRQAASALQYAHDQGITHGDLRPEQMRLRERDKSLLLNGFGLSTLAMLLSLQWGTDNPYLAPELPQQAPQPANDQYSLAAIAYEWLNSALSSLPTEIEQVLNTARAREPGQRFATISAFATALEQASKIDIVQLHPQPHVIPAPIASSIAAQALSDSTLLRPAPPSSLEEGVRQPSPTDVSRVEPDVLSQTPAHRGISRRRLLTGLAVGGTAITGLVAAGAAIAGIGGGVLLQHRTNVSLPSPPKLIYTHHSNYGFLADFGDFFWSPDSKRVAATNYAYNTIQVWDATDEGGQGTWAAAKKKRRYSLQWSRNTLLVAWSLEDQDIIHVQDILNSHDITTFTGHMSNSPEYGINEIAFAPDGERIASLDIFSDNPLLIWNATTGAILCTIKDANAYAMLWSPDGRRILSWGRDQIQRVWDAQTGGAITAHNQELSLAPAWSPNSQYIASGDQTNVVSVRNAHNGQLVCSYKGHPTNHKLHSLRWSPNSAMIASACNEESYVHVWNATTGKRISIHDDDQFTQLDWSPDSKHIASKGPLDPNSRSFEVWDAISGANTISYGTAPLSADLIKWSPDGRLIAAAELNGIDHSLIHIWQVGWGHGG